MRACKRDSRQLVQTGQAFLLITPKPFANGLWRGIKDAGGGLDAIGQGMFYHPQSQIKLVGFAFHPYNLLVIAKRFHMGPLKRL